MCKNCDSLNLSNWKLSAVNDFALT
ncbi:MAG: hypothetical protein E6Q32_11120 [Neisseriales bacterium]|nr:MAG: hypothetical protein E6Q32_11120 [Neisseriales bacterium]